MQCRKHNRKTRRHLQFSCKPAHVMSGTCLGVNTRTMCECKRKPALISAVNDVPKKILLGCSALEDRYRRPPSLDSERLIKKKAPASSFRYRYFFRDRSVCNGHSFLSRRLRNRNKRKRDEKIVQKESKHHFLSPNSQKIISVKISASWNFLMFKIHSF